MNDNQDGHRDVSPNYIVTNVANRFAPPATLRVVPTKMTMDMHMLGAMYAPNDKVTLMAMLNYIDKKMDHITYQGMAGTTVKGKFTTKSDGIGDAVLSAMYRLVNKPNNKWHLNFGVSLPTGDIKEKDTILTPMPVNDRPKVRLPYSMQLGSGTWDLKPGITYNGRKDNITWGAQYMGTFRLGENDEDYTLGNVQEVTAWTAFSPVPWFSYALRLSYQDIDDISGRDERISGPVQTADPDNYGGQSLLGYISFNLSGQSGWIRGHRIAFEYGFPLSQDLNGPQMKQDWTLTGGWQYSF